MPISKFLRASEASPPAPVEAITAPDIDAVKLALRIDTDAADEQLERNITAATALANLQAPGAPEAVADEAIIRMVAWLFEGRTSEISDAGMWRRCGAAGLLAPWTIRRAGAI